MLKIACVGILGALWVSIAGAQDVVESAELKLGSVEAHPGEDVRVPVHASCEDPIRAVFLVFYYDDERLEYLGFDHEESEADGLDRLAVLHKSFPDGQAVGGFDPQRRQSMDFRVPPGRDRHVGWLRFRIKAAAAEGTVALVLSRHIEAVAGQTSLSIEPPHEPGEIDFTTILPAVLGGGEVLVLPPLGPRPVGDLSCEQYLDRGRLTFAPTDVYDRVDVLVDGSPAATLPGDADSWEETLVSVGRRRYEVVAWTRGEPSLPASCDLFAVSPAAPPVVDLICDDVGLRWQNPVPFDRIVVAREDELIADLPGDQQSFVDPDRPSSPVTYTVISEVEGFRSPDVTCIANGVWIYEVGDVEARVDAKTVTVPIYATTPVSIQGFDMYMDVDTEVFGLVRDFDGAIQDTAGHPEPEYFHMGNSGAYWGAPAVGLVWDFYAPLEPEKDLPAGLRQHVFSFIFEVTGDVREGDVYPVGFHRGSFVLRPPQGVYPDCYIPGEIRFGSSGPAPVAGLEAAVAARQSPAGVGGGGSADCDVSLTWTNRGSYDGIRVERNGEVIAEIGGGESGYLDADVPSGVYTYKVRGLSAGRDGAARSAMVSTFAPPGTFLRGDANRDGLLNVADPIATLSFLFIGRKALPCEDAADADDDGVLAITDAVVTLSYLFLGTEVLRSPGTRYPWFDPTPDGLGCLR